MASLRVKVPLASCCSGATEAMAARMEWR
jgi:hypothetical protein